MPAGRLYTPAPVARRHPLNRGLVAWWLGLPGQAGGPTVADIVSGSRANAGSLAGTPSWVGGCPDGFTGVLLNGSSQCVSTGRTTAQLFGPSAPPGITVAWWMRPSTTYNAGTVRGIWGGMNGAGAPEFGCQVYSDNNWYVGFAASGDDDRVTVAASASNYPNGVWSHYVFTTTFGGGSVLYQSGLSIGSSGSAATYQTPSDVWRLGSNSVNYGNYFPGAIGGFQLFTRALPAADVAGVYDQARRGYPDTLWWVPGRQGVACLSPVSPPPPPPAGSGFPAAVVGGGFGW